MPGFTGGDGGERLPSNHNNNYMKMVNKINLDITLGFDSEGGGSGADD